MSSRKELNDLNITPVDHELDERQEQQVQDDGDITFSTHSRREERFLAFNLIYAVDRFDYTVPLDDVVTNFQEGFELTIPQDSYALVLAKGAIAGREKLDEDMVPFLKNWKLNRLGCSTRLILRMALWEIQQPQAIPSIVINEAVELAKIFAEKDAYKFVNGILDQYCKQHNIFVEGNQEEEPA